MRITGSHARRKWPNTNFHSPVPGSHGLEAEMRGEGSDRRRNT